MSEIYEELVNLEIERDTLQQRIRELEAENKRLSKEMQDFIVVSFGLYASNEKLRAENERLREDAARYRWLRNQHWNYSNLVVVTEPRKNVKLGSDMPFEGRLDAAIDAAREQGDE